jgi:curved DNA-binding protein CbpA
MKDYYRILGVPFDADQQAIKTAYRQLARRYHPDTRSDESSDEKMKEINEANAVLSDPGQRAKYDRRRRIVISLDLGKLFVRLVRRIVRA